MGTRGNNWKMLRSGGWMPTGTVVWRLLMQQQRVMGNLDASQNTGGSKPHKLVFITVWHFPFSVYRKATI